MTSIKDREWSINACSAKTQEGINFIINDAIKKKNFFKITFKNILKQNYFYIIYFLLGLQEGMEWLVGKIKK